MAAILNIDQAMRRALALYQAGQLSAAETLYRQVLGHQTDHAEALHMLGVIVGDSGKFDLALQLVDYAIAADPAQAVYHFNRGHFLCEGAQFDAAITAFEQALQLKEDFPDAWFGIGNAQRERGRPDEAVGAFRRAIALRPEFAEAISNLGQTLKDQGALDEAMTLFERAMTLYGVNDPASITIHSNWLYTMLFHPGYDAAQVLQAHRQWDRRHAQHLRRSWQAHANEGSRDRRLRVGYVSPDFRDHVIGRNVLPLIEHHDPRQVEVFCYSDVGRPDAITHRFCARASQWRQTSGLSDEQLAQLVRGDDVDILVDLSLHMSRSRLSAFARKPAPVQTTFAGYPGTTGLSAIDYRLTDPYLDPPGWSEAQYSEISMRLPDSFWCFDPLSAEVQVTPLPAEKAGHVTFGCLNNFCKINAPVLQLWAQVLNIVANSRLILLSAQGSHCARLAETMASLGVRPERLGFVSPRARERYLALYQQIDIGLDTFPYNGHSTSLDALWMGVPVMSLIGPTIVGRAGVSQLTNLGLPELAVSDPQQYVRVVRDLAGDLERLSRLRRSLRGRMEASPLMDAKKFSQGVEAAYRQMWHRWCAGEKTTFPDGHDRGG